MFTPFYGNARSKEYVNNDSLWMHCSPTLYPVQFLCIFALDFFSSSIDVAYFMLSGTNFKTGFKKKLKLRNQGAFVDSLPDIDRKEKMKNVFITKESNY